MDRIVERLQRKASSAHLEIDRGEIFDLLEVAWCPFCCRDGGRGGNENCGPKPVLQE
jgi:hypothetical protein